MRHIAVAAFALPFCCASLAAQSLGLPPRPATAPSGSAFARSIAELPRTEREARIVGQVKAGNVPHFLRALVPVTVGNGKTKSIFFVTADYLAIGSDEDYFLAPLSPGAAQQVAELVGCCLPTTKMVDAIYAAATVKLTPEPIPPSRAMTTIPVFLRHNELVRAQRKEHGKPLGALVAGHKKDVVISSAVFAKEGKVAIYGWHKPDSRPIQPLYTGHTANWVDYSHGIRLVLRRMTVDGAPKTIDEVLADPQLAPLLSNDGVLSRSKY
jgi:hypothetical protein